MTATRRETLRRAALGAGSLSLAGLALPALAAAQSPDDEDLRDFLLEAIELEDSAVLAYRSAAERAEDAELRRTFERFRDQEQLHADALRSALDSLGFDLPDEPGAADELSSLDDLTKAKDDDERSEFLAGLEEEMLALYLGQAPALDSLDLITTSLEIAGCQAQHQVVLRAALGASPAESVPDVPRGG